MMGLVDFAKIANAPWFAVPHFITPEVNWAAALFAAGGDCPAGLSTSAA